MDDTVKMLAALIEENTRYRMAFLNLATKMEKAKEKDAHFLLNEDEIDEVIEIAGVVKHVNKKGVAEWF